MIRKGVILGTTISNTLLLILMLSLGSQNLSSKYNLSLGFSSTEKYPSGFLIGISITLGSLSGGLSSFLLKSSEKKNYF